MATHIGRATCRNAHRPGASSASESNLATPQLLACRKSIETTMRCYACQVSDETADEVWVELRARRSRSPRQPLRLNECGIRRTGDSIPEPLVGHVTSSQVTGFPWRQSGQASGDHEIAAPTPACRNPRLSGGSARLRMDATPHKQAILPDWRKAVCGDVVARHNRGLPCLKSVQICPLRFRDRRR